MTEKFESPRKLLDLIKAIRTVVDGVETSIQIDEVVIVISDEPLSADLSRYASKARKTKWSLAEVKQLISMNPPRIERMERFDGKSDSRNIGISEQEVISIINNLTDANFDSISTDSKNPQLGTDVYKVFQYQRQCGGEPIDLYIKFRIVSKRQRKVFLISFHRDE